jgi:hypothetical protein
LVKQPQLAAGGLDGEIELVLGVVKGFLGLQGVAIHVVVVGSLGALHFVDGIDDMMVNSVEVVPVVDLGNGDSASKGEGKCGNHVNLFHRSFSPGGRFGSGILIRRTGDENRHLRYTNTRGMEKLFLSERLGEWTVTRAVGEVEMEVR